MIRTALSFCLLFGGLLLASKWMHQSVAPAPLETLPQPVRRSDAATTEAKPIPLGQAQAALPSESVIRLVGYEDPVDGVLNSLRAASAASIA